MKTSLFCPLQPRTSWLMLVADGGWGMLPITMYARTKWLTKLAVFHNHFAMFPMMVGSQWDLRDICDICDRWASPVSPIGPILFI